MYFFLVASNYRNTGVTFNFLMKQKSSMEKIMRLMFEDNEANV